VTCSGPGSSECVDKETVLGVRTQDVALFIIIIYYYEL
jgi:hypothetical protein